MDGMEISNILGLTIPLGMVITDSSHINRRNENECRNDHSIHNSFHRSNRVLNLCSLIKKIVNPKLDDHAQTFHMGRIVANHVKITFNLSHVNTTFTSCFLV